MGLIVEQRTDHRTFILAIIVPVAATIAPNAV
jgi:hypothetical protein